MKQALSIILLWIVSYGNAQTPLYFFRADSVKVKSASSYLKNPWAGGLNNPQFSEIDLNFDGIKDLFIFDRSGNKAITYLNQGTVATIDYTHAPEYQNTFPAMTDWVYLADFNCDGKEDIFTHTNGAITIYRNDGNAIDGLKFTLVNSSLQSDYISDTTSITVGAVSLPTISDVDDDGDLDILNFRTSSIYLEFHKNRSMDLYGTCDSLDFILTANCWGYFSENSISNDVNLNDTCSDDISNKNSRHAGSTLLAIDLNGDNDKDLLVGDISFKNMVMLTNGGDNQSAHITAQESDFPSYDAPINQTVFPGAFYVDVNNDTANDLLVSPNAANMSENANSVWYYRNMGTTSSPLFTLEQKNLFQDEMIEMGEGSYPVFFDYNVDGLLDLVIGNYGYYNNTGSYQSGLALYENVGSLSHPEFKFITTDYSSIASLGLQNVIPAFGDMDNDGDADLLIGNKDGALHYFENPAGAGNTASFILTEAFYQGIDVGGFSAPCISDMNNDSKPDLIIGEQNGNLNYFENEGTSTIAAFSTTNNFWGQVDVRQDGSILGYSTPQLVKINTTSHLFVGSESGDIYHYTNIDSNLTGTFTLEDTTLGNIYEGTRSGIGANDLNNDGLLDIIVGNYGGGLALFYGANTGGIKNISSQNLSNIKKLYPNPVDEKLIIEFNRENISSQIKIYDQIGKEIYRSTMDTKSSIFIDTESFSNGIYNIIVDYQNNYESNTFIVIH
jgi:hypothetical protein